MIYADYIHYSIGLSCSLNFSAQNRCTFQPHLIDIQVMYLASVSLSVQWEDCLTHR